MSMPPNRRSPELAAEAAEEDARFSIRLDSMFYSVEVRQSGQYNIFEMVLKFKGEWEIGMYMVLI